jgi:hypothetical protein
MSGGSQNTVSGQVGLEGLRLMSVSVLWIRDGMGSYQYLYLQERQDPLAVHCVQQMLLQHICILGF